MSGKPVVFVVHGMGVHEDGWELESFVEPLEKEASAYDKFKTEKLTDQVDFVGIRYDDVFQDALDAWDENASALLAQAQPGSRDTVEEAVGWLDGISDQQGNFGWTHAADVLLWKISPFFRMTIINRVADTIAAEMTQRTADAPGHSVTSSVVSHSLGTSVIHDTLLEMMRGSWTGSNANGFKPEFFRFDSLHTVANVSKLLEFGSEPVYTSGIKPGDFGSSDSYCSHFYNYHNEFDPFTLPQPFEPGWDVNRFHDKKVSHIYNVNTHGLPHYIKHPRVHITMLRSFVGNFLAVSPGEETTALTNFKPISSKITAGVRDEVKGRATDIAEDMGISADLVDIVKAIARYFASGAAGTDE